MNGFISLSILNVHILELQTYYKINFVMGIHVLPSDFVDIL